MNMTIFLFFVSAYFLSVFLKNYKYICDPCKNAKIYKVLLYLKRGIESNKIIIGGFKIPVSSMDRSYTERINKDILELNYAAE